MDSAHDYFSYTFFANIYFNIILLSKRRRSSGMFQHNSYMNFSSCACSIIDLDQDRDRWRASVNTIMNLRGFLDRLRSRELLRKDSAQWS